MRVTWSSFSAPRLTVTPSRNVLSVADFDARRSDPPITVVLRLGADDAVGKEAIVGRRSVVCPVTTDVAVEPAPIADPDVRTDDAERADLDVVAEFGLRIDLRQW